MEYGGITPLERQRATACWSTRARRVDDPDAGAVVVAGSSLRRSRSALPGALLATAEVEVVDGLALA